MKWSEQESAEYFYRETLVDSGVSLNEIEPLDGSDINIIEKVNSYVKDSVSRKTSPGR